MTHREVVDWFSDMRKTSWIYPNNNRVLNWVIEEPEEEEVLEDIVDTCESCYVCDACFECMCKQGIYRENHYRDFLDSPVCDEYICAEEVNS